MSTDIKLLISGCIFVLSSAIILGASVIANGSVLDILSLIVGAVGLLFVIISLSLNRKDG